MLVTKATPGLLLRPGTLLLFLVLLACSKKGEDTVPQREPEVSTPASAPIADTSIADPRGGDSLGLADSPIEKANPEALAPAPVIPKAAGKPAFRSRPTAKAWPGHPYLYEARLSPAVPFRLHLIKGPDSMQVSGQKVIWVPAKTGSYPVHLEAVWLDQDAKKSQAAGGDTLRVGQAFQVEVEPALSLSLKPLVAKADKGDTVVFDLRGSTYPDWAAGSLTVRFDYEGDGTWDTPELPLPANLLHKHAYDVTGRFAAKVQARHGDFEVRMAEGDLTILSAVDAVLKIQPDTVEPGAMVKVDASGTKGDGRLSFFLDLDGDGKTDWADSSTGKTSLKAPPSGRYQAHLAVRNPMGMEGKAVVTLVSNARPRLAIRIRNGKENMSAPVDALLEAGDADDSLRSMRINFTGEKDAWTASGNPDSANGPGQWRKAFKHAYGKIGKFQVEACVSSADGRETCQKSAVEIFNAPPEIESLPLLKATLGVPAEIVGKGRDPDGAIVKWEWDLDGDGKFDMASRKDGKVKYTFARKGTFSQALRVTTADGMTTTVSRKVEVRKKW